MAASTELITSTRVQRGAPLVASVEVRGARPGSRLTVRIEHKRGAGPRFPAQEKVAAAGPTGIASASFIVTMPTAGPAVLLATVHDGSETTFPPDAEMVEVL